jgi:hypothetical protein
MLSGVRFLGSMALAATGSGVPSTLVALARGDDVLASTRAAGTLLVGEEAARTSQLLAGVAAHLAISTLWTGVLWRTLPRRHRIASGAAAGLAIAAIDLGVVGRRRPAIRRLDLAPQVMDHIAFGAIVGWTRNRASDG